MIHLFFCSGIISALAGRSASMGSMKIEKLAFKVCDKDEDFGLSWEEVAECEVSSFRYQFESMIISDLFIEGSCIWISRWRLTIWGRFQFVWPQQRWHYGVQGMDEENENGLHACNGWRMILLLISWTDGYWLWPFYLIPIFRLINVASQAYLFCSLL